MTLSKKNLLQLLLAFVLAVCCVGLGGCVAYPDFSTTERSPDIRGRVIDYKTGRPIANARVSCLDYPNEATLTDTQGRFHLPGARNHHLVAAASWYGSNSYPQDAPHCESIVITHPKYWPGGTGVREPDVLLPGQDSRSSHLLLGDLLMAPLTGPNGIWKSQQYNSPAQSSPAGNASDGKPRD